MTKRNLFAGKLIFLLLNFTSEFTLLSNSRYSFSAYACVLLYSEFTLLSNCDIQRASQDHVLLYSEFTLLSDLPYPYAILSLVLLYSEFTLLSNQDHLLQMRESCFTVF